MTREQPPAAGMRDVRVLATVGFFISLGFGIVSPAIPLFAQSFGVSTTAIASAISAVALFRMVCALGAGWLVERLGERTVLVTGLLLVASTTGAAGWAPSFPVFLALRSASGVGTALMSVASLALLLRSAPPSQRARAAARYQGGFLLGALSGPALGGVLTDLSPELPFLAYAALLLVAVAVALGLLTGHEPADGRSGDAGGAAGAEEVPGPVRAVLLSRAYLVALLVNFGVGWFLSGVRLSLVPLYVTEELGQTAAWAGFGLLAGSLAQVVGIRPAGRLADEWGRRPSLLVGCALAVASISLLALPPSTGLFLGAMAGYGFAATLLGTVPAALVADVAPKRSGRVVAVFQMSADLGSITGPLVAGALTDAVSFQAAFVASAVVVGAGALGALALPGRRSGAPPLVAPPRPPAPAAGGEDGRGPVDALPGTAPTTAV